MDDRNVQFPQRYQLKKVSGTDDIYDLIPAPGEITSEGTLINKGTLWKDVTAALFGLGADSVPDDGFAYLGKYAQHWWKRRNIWYQEIQTENKKTDYQITGSSVSLTYSKNIIVDQVSGEINFDSPLQVSVSSSNGQPLVNLAPVYIKGCNGSNSNEKDIIYFPKGTTYVDNEDETKGTLVKNYGNLSLGTPPSSVAPSAFFVTAEKAAGDWEYVQSSSRSTYPDSGEQDGYEYEYLGIPFDNAAGAPKIETGSYVGTGTYGQNNPNSLTFWFSPRIVVIAGSQDLSFPFVYPNTYVYTRTGTGSNLSSVPVSWGTNSITWYDTDNAHYQLNSTGTEYHYIAIG